MLIYDDVPADLILNCSLVEHDSGDISEYKRKIAVALEQAAKDGLAAVGAPAEATAANQGFIGDVTLGIVNAVSGWVGADDDPYTPQAARISARDILIAIGMKRGPMPGASYPFPDRPAFEREDTPGVKLEYNIDPVVVTGIDQGGDRGEYAFYFRVEPYWKDTHLPQ